MPISVRETWDHAGRLYESVAANSETAHDTVIPAGDTWNVLRVIANGAYMDDTLVALWWDKGGSEEELLAAAHGDALIPVGRKLTGNGSRKLSIVLSNDTSSAHVMGGHWDAKDA